MLKLILSVLVALLGLSPVAGRWVVAQQASNPDAEAESRFLSRIRRLTYDGARAGEGYYSYDGTKMVLQSEREADNPFYQIYQLDLTTGETRRISSGVGKTTCAFIHPVTGEVEYASTHLDPDSLRYQHEEFDMRASGQERRYAWDYDPAMDIFVTDPATGKTRQLTDARGYDAEGSYSPDGEWIVFSSNRNAYTRELTGEEKHLLEIDPAYFADLWIMRADGSDQRQLTHVPGYDGGPFFFHDGSRIVWRRFHPSGLRADIYSANPDGTDERRLTDFGSMSWAPYVHPSRQYVFFASNKLGFENFEVFMVDVDGEKEPVRVTYSDRFDGLPVPAPDGATLSWTSQRHGEEGSQIFIAQWSHEAALASLAAAPARVRNSEESGQWP